MELIVHQIKLLVGVWGLLVMVFFFVGGWACNWDKKEANSAINSVLVVASVLSFIIWGFFL